MANEIQTKTAPAATFTITLASLDAGMARQSTLIDNSTSQAHGAIVYVKITSGAIAPTAGRAYEVYLIRSSKDATTPIRDDGAGTTDAAITIENAPLLGTIVVTNNASKAFYGVFDTGSLGPLGPEWGIAVKNNTDQGLDATAANHVCQYVTYLPEVQ